MPLFRGTESTLPEAATMPEINTEIRRRATKNWPGFAGAEMGIDSRFEGKMGIK